MGDFLKKVPHTPQKLSKHFINRHVCRYFSTATSAGQIGPQLPTCPLFVFRTRGKRFLATAPLPCHPERSEAESNVWEASAMRERANARGEADAGSRSADRYLAM